MAAQDDPIWAMKLRVMYEMRILPTDDRVRRMSTTQWFVMAKYIDDAEKRKKRGVANFWAGLLGLTTKGGKVLPLSFFIEPKMASEIYDPNDITDEESEELIVTDDETSRMEDVMNTDIDMLLTDEDRERIDKAAFDQLLEEERRAGVIVKGDN